MSRLPAIDPASATGKPAELLAAVKAKLGLVPNMTRVMANSVPVLEAYLGFSGSLGHGKLSAKLREQIAIVVAETTSCSYCLSAHTAIGKLVGLNPAELAAARDGTSEDARSTAALKFSQNLVIRQGDAKDADIAALRAAGFSDGEIAEIIANVALNLFTNFFNKAAGVEVDFPKVTPRVAVAV